jgi:hypothetical protein
MLDFNRSREADFQDFGRWVWQQSEQFLTHEQVSQFITAALFEEFIVNGEAQLALVRIYRLMYTEELPNDLRYRVPPGERVVLALSGTFGIELNWCDRRLSRGHQLLPLSRTVISHKIPMFQEMLVQCGVELDDLRQGVIGPDHFRSQFFVHNAVNSPLLPAQSDFIHPYCIQSEIGFGGYVPGFVDRHCLYFLTAFSCVPISPDAAQRFFTMQDYIGTALANQSHFVSIFD